MTTSISSEAFEKKTQKVKEWKMIQKTKNHKCKNGQSELLFSDHKNEEKHFIKNHETLFTILY